MSDLFGNPKVRFSHDIDLMVNVFNFQSPNSFDVNTLKFQLSNMPLEGATGTLRSSIG